MKLKKAGAGEFERVVRKQIARLIAAIQDRERRSIQQENGSRKFAEQVSIDTALLYSRTRSGAIVLM